MKHCIYTSINNAYLSKALMLARSVKALHPDVWFVCALVDEIEPHLLADSSDFDEVIVMGDNVIPDFTRWVFEHTVVEACTGIKGPVLDQLLASREFQTVTYLDPDTFCYSRLSEILDNPDRSAVILTPHLTSPALSDRTIQANELSALRHGTFNLGFVSVSASDQGRQFAAWWADRTQRYSFDEIDRGIFTDQRWVDLAPSYFDFVEILRHPGYNFSTWNAEHRHLKRRGSVLLCNEEPLRFAHFSGLDSGNHNATREAFAPNDEVFRELSLTYQAQLKEIENNLPIRPEWAYSKFASGEHISNSQRRQYRDSDVLQRNVLNPFTSNRSMFDALISEPILQLEAEFNLEVNTWLDLERDIGLDQSKSARVRNNEGPMAALSFALLQRKTGSSRPLVIHLSHGRGGGSDLHVRELITTTGAELDSLWIRPNIETQVELRFDVTLSLGRGNQLVSETVTFTPRDLEAFVKSCDASVIHFHHLLGTERHFAPLTKVTDVIKIFTLHDFYVFEEDWRFIEVPDPTVEQMAKHLKQKGLRESDRRKRMLQFLSDMDVVLAPSLFVQEVVQSVCSIEKLIVRAHPESLQPESVPVRTECLKRLAKSSVVRAAVVGDLSTHKGVGKLRELLLYANSEGESIIVHHYGAPCPELEGLVVERGRFDRRYIAGTLIKDEVDVGLLFNSAPESYSYALSDLMLAGLPIVAFSVGAVQERLVGREGAVLLSPESSAEQIFTAITSLRSTASRWDMTKPNETSAVIPVRMSSDLYKDLLGGHFDKA